MPDILVSEYIDPAGLARLQPEFDVHYDPDLWQDENRLAAVVADVPGWIVRNQTQVRGSVLEAASVLQCVGRLGVGLDNIDTGACEARGISVFPATGANSDSVAELAIGGLLVLFRKAYHATDQVIAGDWPRMRMMGREIMGKTLGIVGFGSIGRALAWRAKGLGMTVVAWDPLLPADEMVWSESGVTRRDLLDDVLVEADAVSVHVPLLDDTRDLINARALSKMKKDAVLLNLARGGIVNEDDLVAALKDGRIGGAFLDTFDTEPLPAANIFAGVPNLLLTPHVGARTEEADHRVCTMIADAVAGCLRGGR